MSNSSSFFALFANLQDRPVLLVGAGVVAERKALALLKAGARIKVVAQNLSEQFLCWLEEEKIDYLGADFYPEQMLSVYLAVAATDDEALNQRVYLAAEAQSKFCNVVDSPKHCSYITPAVIDRHPLQIAISSGGTAPVLARLWRERIESQLPQHIGKVASFVEKWRDEVREKINTLAKRRYFWEEIFRGPLSGTIEVGDEERAAQIMRDTLLQAQTKQQQKQLGEVVLVGAGPGDAGLLTLKGLQAIQAADVVLYDALVSPEVLELVRRDADRVNVGKRAGAHHVIQDKTNRLMVKLAKEGKRVVRLKGGDPFVFGRGGEEAQVLVKEGIPFRVVPGISAALGATAYAGIPLTHREHAHSAILISGHGTEEKDENDWQALAKTEQTLVVYMGSMKSATIQEQLIANGRDVNTPVAIISRGTTEQQEVVIGKLSELGVLATKAPRPALIVIGEVVSLQQELAWFQQAEETQDEFLTV
ncbi:MAG: uroporphyrinogen-III C-methyltransferase [Alcaligenaceae bacterium]|nr:uroporphyrinogen-III C-methyltransferase [Alcaligenaceae bacterium]HZJ97671.1 siroheme synthase CysG [Oligella sp.]